MAIKKRLPTMGSPHQKNLKQYLIPLKQPKCVDPSLGRSVLRILFPFSMNEKHLRILIIIDSGALEDLTGINSL